MGKAKSPCIAWAIENLLTEIKYTDLTFSPNLAKKIYLLEDSLSPVVILELSTLLLKQMSPLHNLVLRG